MKMILLYFVPLALNFIYVDLRPTLLSIDDHIVMNLMVLHLPFVVPYPERYSLLRDEEDSTDVLRPFLVICILFKLSFRRKGLELRTD